MKKILAILLIVTMLFCTGCDYITDLIGGEEESSSRSERKDKEDTSENQEGLLSAIFGNKNEEQTENAAGESEEEETEEQEEPEAEQPKEEAEEYQDIPATPTTPEADPEPYVSDQVTVPTEEDQYLFPSESRLITEADLMGRTKDEVTLILNEIYARHGYIFKMDKFRTYFSAQSWYHPNNNYSDSLLTDIEKSNIEFIADYQERMGWR